MRGYAVRKQGREKNRGYGQDVSREGIKTMRRIHAALFFMALLLFVSVYAVAFGADGDSDSIVGEWNCVKTSEGAITPIKYFEFKEDGSVTVVVGDCRGFHGTYELAGDDEIAIGKFQDVEITSDKPLDGSLRKIALDILYDVEGSYEYRVSPSGKELTLAGKRGAEYEFEKTE